MKKTILALVAAFLFSAVSSYAATILFDLQGKAGTGLLSGNENGAIAGTPGSGGEIGSGISFDDVSLVLTLNIGWGTGNGFTNLSGNATAGHIHGPTASGGVGSFTQNAGVLISLDTLPSWNSNATSGGLVNGTVTLTSTQATDLLAGKFYVNAHTAINGGGEIRGNLIVAPEPTAIGLFAFGLASIFLLRCKKKGFVNNS